MPTSITLVATSTSISPARMRAITSRFSRRLHLPCITPTAEVARTPTRQPLGLARRGARLQLLRLLDQRADDVALPAFAQALADEL